MDVVWRAGLDLNPLDVTDPDDRAWLDALVWPGEEHLRDQLHTAAEVATADPPHLVRGDLLTDLPALLADAPGVAGLDLVARLLQAQGRVLPMAAVPLTIEADVTGLDPTDPDAVQLVSGQAQVAATPGTVGAVRLVPGDPPAYPESVAAIRSADWVVLGPGSWFTSVMTHLLVPEVREALEVTRARRLLVLNLDPGTGETKFASTSAEHDRNVREFQQWCSDNPGKC